ncbi:MAG: hypothetical protein ABI808_05995 [Pseudonocardiales bacterium]
MLDVDTRGLVNQLTYGVNLDEPVTEADAQRVAGHVVGQRVYSSPISSYYRAAEAALQDSEALASNPDADRRAHDFLRRLLRALDERRPWAELPYEEVGPAAWSKLMAAPVIGSLDLLPTDVRDRVSRSFTRLDDSRRGLILRLQTGQTVGFLASTSPGPGVEVRSADDSEQTRADLHELTGLDVIPG